MVIPVQPGWQGRPAGPLGAVGAGVGPLGQQGPVEPLDLAVGGWPVGPGPLVGHPLGGQQLPPGVAAVAGAVVGQDPLDGDPAFGEPGTRPGPEPAGGPGLLIRVDLGVGQPGVVVDRGVQLAVAVARVAAVGAPAGRLVGLAVALAGCRR
jgi:hypothetical protein